MITCHISSHIHNQNSGSWCCWIFCSSYKIVWLWGILVLRRIKLTSQKLGQLAHSYPLFGVTFLEGELWLSQMGLYPPRSIWNFYALISGLVMKAGKHDFGKWSSVSCLESFFFFFFHSCRQSVASLHSPAGYLGLKKTWCFLATKHSISRQ